MVILLVDGLASVYLHLRYDASVFKRFVRHFTATIWFAAAITGVTFELSYFVFKAKHRLLNKISGSIFICFDVIILLLMSTVSVYFLHVRMRVIREGTTIKQVLSPLLIISTFIMFRCVPNILLFTSVCLLSCYYTLLTTFLMQ